MGYLAQRSLTCVLNRSGLAFGTTPLLVTRASEQADDVSDDDEEVKESA